MLSAFTSLHRSFFCSTCNTFVPYCIPDMKCRGTLDLEETRRRRRRRRRLRRRRRRRRLFLSALYRENYCTKCLHIAPPCWYSVVDVPYRFGFKSPQRSKVKVKKRSFPTFAYISETIKDRDSQESSNCRYSRAASSRSVVKAF